MKKNKIKVFAAGMALGKLDRVGYYLTKVDDNFRYMMYELGNIDLDSNHDDFKAVKYKIDEMRKKYVEAQELLQRATNRLISEVNEEE